MNIDRNYEIARELYAQYGIDTDAVLEKMKEIPVGRIDISFGNAYN